MLGMRDPLLTPGAVAGGCVEGVVEVAGQPQPGLRVLPGPGPITVAFQIPVLVVVVAFAVADFVCVDVAGVVAVQAQVGQPVGTKTGGVPNLADRSWVCHGSPGKPMSDR